MRGVIQGALAERVRAAGRDLPGGVALFDADGTLWREDVGEAFLRHLVSLGLVQLPDGSDPYEAYERAVDRDRASGYAYAAQLQAGLEVRRVEAEAPGTLADFAGLSPDEIPIAIDGCGVPAFFLSLQRAALAYARLMAAASLERYSESAANVVEAEVDGDALRLTRQRWGGSLLEQARLTGTPKLLTVAPHATDAEPAGIATTVDDFTPTLSDEHFRVRVTRREEPSPGTVRLDTARVVVGGTSNEDS